MADADNKLRVALLVVPESTASTVYGLYDLLATAGRDWPVLMGGVPGPQLIQPQIVSAAGRRVAVANGLWLEPEYALRDCPRPDVIVIADLSTAPDEDIAGRHPEALAWLRQCYAEGSAIATACTGALLLAETGLLDGEDCTTHWGFCEAMAQRYPRIRLQPQRALVIAGEGQRLIMAGGGSSWQDLGLFLVARYCGSEEAMRVARLHLLDWHHVGQQPFAALTRSRQVEDALIARCQEWIAQHYDEDAPVTAMAQLSGLPERSFKRRFTRATGLSPLDYVHTLRLEEAKLLLETGDAPIEAVANQVGYQDASFFGRLFRRKVGLTPAHYRRRFGALRRALEQDAPDRA